MDKYPDWLSLQLIPFEQTLLYYLFYRITHLKINICQNGPGKVADGCMKKTIFNLKLTSFLLDTNIINEFEEQINTLMYYQE